MALLARVINTLLIQKNIEIYFHKKSKPNKHGLQPIKITKET